MINLNHLKYFYDAARYESFTKSAKNNHVSHSAISQAIRNLEQFYGTELVSHKKNHFELTDEGKALQENVQKIFDSVLFSKKTVENSKTEYEGTFKIGFSQSMAMSFIPGFLKIFRKKYPKVLPSIKLSNSTQLANLIKDRTVDIGIGIDDGQFLKLESKTLKRGKFVLVSSVKENDLKKATFLIGDKGLEVIRFKQWYQKNKLANDVIEIESWEVATRLIQSGIGVGVIPDYILETNPTKLHVIDAPLNLPGYELKAFYRNKESLSRNCTLLLDFLFENKKN
jgi:DNA-binding transcriptional LysR family regulator